jgi:hypothetical protein
MEAVCQAAFEGGGAPVQFGQPCGETMRGSTQPFEPSPEAGSVARQALRAAFEAGVARGEAAERAVQFGRDAAHAPRLLVLGGEDASQQSLLLCDPVQSGVAASGRFEFSGKATGAPQSLASEAGKEGVEFDFQGKTRTGCFLAARGEAPGAGREASESAARPRPTGGSTVKRAGEQAGSRTRPF